MIDKFLCCFKKLKQYSQNHLESDEEQELVTNTLRELLSKKFVYLFYIEEIYAKLIFALEYECFYLRIFI